MTDAEDQAHAARNVLAGTFHGLLSTHSLALAGYPFGSLVPFKLGQEGLPLFLLSHLSQHTKNLAADNRCGLTLVEAGDGDVQQRGRLSAMGEVMPFDGEDDRERFFRYFPQSRAYFEQLGFRFFCFKPLRFHWNGGFATARWFDCERIIRPNPLSPDAQRHILDHMNQDHQEALRGYVRGAIEIEPVDDVHMVGIDAEGIDVLVSGHPKRIPLKRPIASPTDAREVLVEMAADSRRTGHNNR